jgi:hypothetical protein
MDTDDLKEFLSKNLFEYNKPALIDEIHKLNDKKTLRTYLEQNKLHIFYLDLYLSARGLDAKFFMIETDYINKDYLVDFSNYYSFCFEDYRKKCSRIHFFRYENANKELFAKDIYKYVLPVEEKEYHATAKFFEENYIGCIVINPIPNTFFGYTLLKHYNCFKNVENRFFWGTKTYNIHFFGIEIPIPTLAFHEQDNNVSACATISIWSVLQKAAEDYYINLKSPVEITKDAGSTNYDGQRMLPNSGLVPQAICSALTKNNLATEIRNFNSIDNIKNYLCRLIYAYSTLELPIILGIDVPDHAQFAGHAVAICGHRISPNDFNQNSGEFVSKADNITQIYYHDDQWGPFVSASFPSKEAIEKNYSPAIYPWNNSDSDLFKQKLIDSTWTEIEGDKGYQNTYFLNEDEIKAMQEKGKPKIFSVLRCIIIPTFPKVRICYDTIEKIIVSIQQLIKDLFKLEENSWKYLNWDIRVRYSKDLKKEIRNLEFKNNLFSIDEFQKFKFAILSQSLPKYIWVATMCFDKEKFISFVFDATGLVNSHLLIHAIFYIPQLKDIFKNILYEINEKNSNNASFEQIYKELIEGCSKDNFFI